MGSLYCMCVCVYPKCAATWYFTQSCDAVQIVCWHCLVLLLCKAEGRKREPSQLHLPVHQHFSEPIHFTSDQTNHQIIMSQALQTLSDNLQTWLLYMVQWYYVVLDMYSDRIMYTPWYMTTVIVQYHSIDQSTKVFDTNTVPWYCHNTFLIYNKTEWYCIMIVVWFKFCIGFIWWVSPYF